MAAPSRIFDCFTFYDELDLLELRLEVMAPYVDAIVLVEADKTFSGLSKPLTFAENRGRFSEWSDKIRHIVVNDPPPSSGDRWAAEIHQRNAMVRGLEDAQDRDVILVSDVDEIVHPEVLLTLHDGCRGLTALEMPRTFRYANWQLDIDPYDRLARAIPFGLLSSPHYQRCHAMPERVIKNSGCHFTTLGDAKALRAKFESYAHDNMDDERYKSGTYLGLTHRMGLDVFSRRLISPLSASQLNSIQREFLRLRPDLFEFGALPPRTERELFRWYAGWRARQPASSAEVPELDATYDEQRTRVMKLAAAEVVRHWVRYLPRKLASVVSFQPQIRSS